MRRVRVQLVMAEKISFRVFLFLVIATLFSAVVFSYEVLYGDITVKALWLRSFVMLALPLYIYLLLANPGLRPNLRNPLTLAVVAFALFSLLSGIFGVNPIRSFWGNYERMGGAYHLLHLTLLYFYLLLLAKAHHDYFKKVLQLLVGLGVLSSICGITQAAGVPFLHPNTGWFHRVPSFQGNPIFFASFLILPLALAVYFWSQADTRPARYLYLGLVTLQLAGILVSGTRGAMVALLAGAALTAVLFFLKHGSWLNKRRALELLAGAALAVALLFGVFQRFPGGLPLHRITSLKDNNAKARLYQWRIAWRGYRDRPLLGVGPENYYIISNKSSEPRTYTYDDSWFDKPHNFPLEVLATTGMLGFLAYAGIFVFMLLATVRAARAQLISWPQSVILISGIVMYDVQNLFAFDTLAASLAFYVYAAFLGSLWPEDQPRQAERAAPADRPTGAWVKPLCWIAAGFALWIVYVTNVVTAATLHELQEGELAGTADPYSAKAHFDRAAQSAFVFDRGAVGNRYEDFAVRLVEDKSSDMAPAFANSALDASIAVLERAVSEVSTDPKLWFHLAYLYAEKAHFNKAAPDPRGDADIQRAIALAPSRIEPLFYSIQYDMLEDHFDRALAVAQHVVQVAPYDGQARWVLAQVYRSLHQDDLAIGEAAQATEWGYQITLLKDFVWLIDYYADKHDYETVAELYEEAARLNPTDVHLYTSLAATYAQLGDKTRAIAVAQKALMLNPALEPDLKQFLKSLQ